jgi:hypothetical protein
MTISYCTSQISYLIEIIRGDFATETNSVTLANTTRRVLAVVKSVSAIVTKSVNAAISTDILVAVFTRVNETISTKIFVALIALPDLTALRAGTFITIFATSHCAAILTKNFMAKIATLDGCGSFVPTLSACGLFADAASFDAIVATLTKGFLANTTGGGNGSAAFAKRESTFAASAHVITFFTGRGYTPAAVEHRNGAAACTAKMMVACQATS